MRLVPEKLKSSHHVTSPYCPPSNGTFEVVCREVLRATRAVLSELQLTGHAWASLISIVQAAINSAPTKRLAGKCLLTVFTGLKQDNTLISIKETPGEEHRVLSIGRIKAVILMKI